MIYNDYIACNICNTCINLRIQMDTRKIPFKFNCPSCEMEISGEILFQPYNVIVNNARLVEEPEQIMDQYCLELSSFFTVLKMNKRENIDIEGPFLRKMGTYQNSRDLQEDIDSKVFFAQNCQNNKFLERINYYRLFLKRQDEHLFPVLKKEISQYSSQTPIKDIKNRFDALCATHQLLFSFTGLFKLFGGTVYQLFSDIWAEILDSKHTENIVEYAEYINPRLDNEEFRGLQLLEEFSNIYDVILPVIQNEDLEVISLNSEEGLSQDYYDSLKHFYAHSYEWILDNINIVIALNNIFSRGSYRECINGKDYLSDLENIKSKIKKIDFLEESGRFSPKTESIKNRIRNAVQHFNTKIDYNEQQVIFIDKYGDREREESISLYEFSKMCSENLFLIIYLFELMYSLRKLLFINRGLKTTANIEMEKKMYELRADNEFVRKNPRINKKIGRNEKCPCGSGRKYKKCCGK